jgi:alpha-1,2-mannosyltransferase
LSLLVAASIFVPVFAAAWTRQAQLDLTSIVHAVDGLLSGRSLYTVSPEDSVMGLVPYIYPPAGAFLYLPLTFLSDRGVVVVWMMAEAAAMVWAIRLSFLPVLNHVGERLRLPVLVTLVALSSSLLFPNRFHVMMGQLGIFLMCATLADTVPKRTPWPRGLLVGLATAVKLIPAVFILYFIVTRQFRAAVTSCMTVAAAWGLAWLIFPIATDEFFPDGLGSRMSVEFDLTRFDNMSVRSVIARWAPDAPALLWVLIAAAALALCLVVARRIYERGESLAAATMIGLVSLFASPISWSHYLVWIIPAIGVILGSGTVLWRRLAALAIALPFLLRPDSIATSPFATEGYTMSGFAYTLVNDRYAITVVAALVLIVLASRSADEAPVIRTDERGPGEIAS